MSRAPLSTIDTAPLTGVCIGLFMAALPLASNVAPWALALFASALVVRLLVNRWRLPLPSLPVKIGVLAAGVAGITLSYGSILGIEPGLGLLLLLVSLKLLETNTVRDFQVLTLLGWFLSLCGLFFSQELGTWLYIAATAGVLTASLVRFHLGPGTGGFWSAGRLAATLLLQSLPIVVVLFLFFPRSHGGFRFAFNRAFNATSGMSDSIEPGSVAALAMSDEIAFTAEFPDRNVPTLPQMYWRGSVMWRGNGLSWSRGAVMQIEPLPTSGTLKPIRQRIILEPHGGAWLFALDRPSSEVRNAMPKPGGYLQSVRQIITTTRYEVSSLVDVRETILPVEHRREALRVPEQLSPRVRTLAASWRSAAASDREVVESALRHFRSSRFVYTLTPGQYKGDALDEFLFERRSGFCEHYAAAFATLMRTAGIPARLVTGYLGGEYNRLGGYVRVRQSECHVWCEVWLKDSGWKRVDPTNVIAPERVNSGLESFLASQAAADQETGGEASSGALGLREMLREIRLAWDSLKYQWDVRVLNFDEENQRTFFASLGLGSMRWPELFTWIVLAIAASLGLLALWLSHATRPRLDPVSRDYARFCRILAAGGVRREAAEGPLAFAERAARTFPHQAERIRRIGQLYVALRYSRVAPPRHELARAVRELRRARTAKQKLTPVLRVNLP